MKLRPTPPRWTTSLRDPDARAIVVLVAIAVAGFVMAGVAWHGVAATTYVPLQLPWLVSAGVVGLATVGIAVGAWSIHVGRRQDAAHRDAVETLVRDAITLCEEIRAGR